MIDYKEVAYDKISIHSIGNYILDEELIVTDNPVAIMDPNLKDLLSKYFFTHFKVPEFFAFDPKNEALENNKMYNLIDGIFTNPETIHEASKEIAEHLYTQSDNGNIKSGDLVVAYFEDVVVEDEMVSAIGIYKSENKEDFLKMLLESKDYRVLVDKGINVNKLDKACLIFNSNKSKGYKLLATDKKKLNGEAQYWMRDFLHVSHREDDFNSTTVYIQATKAFIDEKLKADFDLDKKDEVAILDASKDYFGKNESFNEEEYLESVFQSNEKVKGAFDDYKKDRQLNLSNNFDISEPAVKRNSSVFKSVLKLDKNFHVYVHGNRDMIVRGEEEDGRKYYKLYFHEEA